MAFEEADIEDVRDAVRELCGSFPPEYWEEKDRLGEYPSEFHRAFADGGWLGAVAPEEFGGGGGGVRVGATILQEVARCGALTACSTVHMPMFIMASLAEFGSEEQKQRYIPAIADGELFASFGVTEPNAGTDTTKITTRATKVDGGYIVNGQKTWNSGALQAQRILLLARTSPYDADRRTAGMSLFFASFDQPGVTISPIRKIGRNAVASCDVVFEDFFIPDEDLIGEEGKGFKYILSGLNSERIYIASEALGIGKWALERAVSYANEREVFDRPIGKNQAVQHPLARDYMALEAAQLAVNAAIDEFDKGEDPKRAGELANIAKYLASEAAFQTTDDAMQTHGGYAFAREYHIGRYWTESRLMRIAPVNNQMVLNFVAQNVLGLPRSY